jgi:hypothetical protein
MGDAIGRLGCGVHQRHPGASQQQRDGQAGWFGMLPWTIEGNGMSDRTTSLQLK